MCRAGSSICKGMCFDAFYSLRLLTGGTGVKYKKKKNRGFGFFNFSTPVPMVVDTTPCVIAFLPPPLVDKVMKVGGRECLPI